MSTQHTPGPWYAANMGNDYQGLVIDEKTGANIAVTYDKRHAPFVAAAPAMYEALQDAYGKLCYLAPDKFDDEEHAANWQRDLSTMLAALTQAEGRG